MAYDPEARSTSNSAMIIGIVALVLMVGGAFAYFTTQPTEPAPVPVLHTERTVIQQPPVAPVAPVIPAAPVVIEKNTPVIVPSPPTTRVIERDTHTTTTHVVTPPAAPSAPRSSTTTNVTVNTPPANPNKTTSQPQAGSEPDTTKETTTSSSSQ